MSEPSLAPQSRQGVRLRQLGRTRPEISCSALRGPCSTNRQGKPSMRPALPNNILQPEGRQHVNLQDHYTHNNGIRQNEGTKGPDSVRRQRSVRGGDEAKEMKKISGGIPATTTDANFSNAQRRQEEYPVERATTATKPELGKKPPLRPFCGGNGDDLTPHLTSSPSKKHHGRQAFNQRKREVADTFLRELDERLTGGQLFKLTGSTGGIKINWTNRLTTTAGRANWKRELIKTTTEAGTEGQHSHYASIDLAEKVIDDEHRLLNVVAHEFCHLANFMITGVTKNPHGKEFQVWAKQCSEAFRNRGINVTTKHSYSINSKYVWTCVECSLEYKRHSKSIDPLRHRCGTCKGHLQQTKPLPRATLSEYQLFVRAEMKLIRQERSQGISQREIMKVVADRWAILCQRKEETDNTIHSTASITTTIESALNALEL